MTYYCSVLKYGFSGCSTLETSYGRYLYPSKEDALDDGKRRAEKLHKIEHYFYGLPDPEFTQISTMDFVVAEDCPNDDI